MITSTSPQSPDDVVVSVPATEPRAVRVAAEAARKAQPDWIDAGAAGRAQALDQAAGAVQGYITGNLVISLVAGVAAFIMLTVIRVPYGVVLALVVALFDLIPLVGATLGAAIVVIVALFIDPTKGAILAVYFLVYQQIENN
ncbi:MAG TPA: AI-2E family transporter, partial [Jatrophihabitans sp.]